MNTHVHFHHLLEQTSDLHNLSKHIEEHSEEAAALIRQASEALRNASTILYTKVNYDKATA